MKTRNKSHNKGGGKLSKIKGGEEKKRSKVTKRR